MIYVLCLIIGIAIGYFLRPLKINELYLDKEKELKKLQESIGMSYSKDTLDDYDDEIFIMDLPYRNTKLKTPNRITAF